MLFKVGTSKIGMGVFEVPGTCNNTRIREVMKASSAERLVHVLFWSILIGLFALVGCTPSSVQPKFLGDYRITDSQVVFLENVAYSNVKEDSGVVNLLQVCRPKLKQLMTGPLQQSLSKRPGAFIYVPKWPAQVRLYQQNGRIFHVAGSSKTIQWAIENRALELLKDGSVKIVDTGNEEPK